MDELVERAVMRAVEYMHQNLEDEITIDDIARSAMFSRYYLTRLFQRTTGISPGRFLSAVRIERAKRYLVETELTVTEVSYRVGYNSIGTFSSRFHESVGLSPSAFRRHRGRLTHLPGESGTGGSDPHAATLRGQLRSPFPVDGGPVFVGLFPTRLPQGTPVRWAVLPETGTYLLDNVPSGSWYLVVDQTARHGERLVAARGPVTVRTDTDVHMPDLWLRPVCPLDPPLLLARLDERAVAARLAPAASPVEVPAAA